MTASVASRRVYIRDRKKSYSRRRASAKAPPLRRFVGPAKMRYPMRQRADRGDALRRFKPSNFRPFSLRGSVCNAACSQARERRPRARDMASLIAKDVRRKAAAPGRPIGAMAIELAGGSRIMPTCDGPIRHRQNGEGRRSSGLRDLERAMACLLIQGGQCSRGGRRHPCRASLGRTNPCFA